MEMSCWTACYLTMISVVVMLTSHVDATEDYICSVTGQTCSPDAPLGTRILIKGGNVVNADRQQIADVYIEDGIIMAVQPNIKATDEIQVIDASGRYVMPGGIDPHTHLAMPFMGHVTSDDFFSGQAAALAGGTTMHIDFALPHEGDLAAGFKIYQEKAKIACMDYGFHMAVTSWNERVSRDMETLVKSEGVNSFKFFMAYKGSIMVTDEELLQGLKKCKELGALAQVHAENGDAVVEGQRRMIELGITGPEGHGLSRPPILEAEATSRAIRLANFVNTPLYVVHVMSKEAMEEIARARQTGQRVIGEPVISGLALDDSILWHSDFDVAAKYVMSPPIRPTGHNTALQAALSTGLLQVVGTDHCTFNSTQKASGKGDFRKIPNGVNGIEERMHVLWNIMVNSGKITPMDYVRVTSTACAQVFNIYPQKGAILPGSDADVILLNPNATTTISAKTHHSKSDTNIYEGWTLKGKIETTISRGRVVWHDGKLNVNPGSGRYIAMPPFGNLFDGLDQIESAYLSSIRRRRQ